MDYTLKRLLTYTDKYRIEEFELPEKVHDVLYELFVTTKENIPVDDLTFVKVFNEVFYMLTCIFADKTSPEHVTEYLEDTIVLTPSEEEYSNQKAYEDDLYYIQRYIFSFVWIILKTHKSLPKHVRFFLIALENRLEQEHSTSYAHFKAFLQKHSMQHELDFPLNPIFDFEIPGRTVDEWEEVTFDFDKESVAEIVHRFHHINSRELIIHEIRKALEEANELPYSSKKVSMRTHRTKANDVFLNELLKESKEEEAQRVEQEKIAEKSKDDHIAELEAQVKQLKKEKDEAIREKKEAERERDKYHKKLDELISRLNRKYIPAELKTEEAKLIINELIKKDIISPLGHNNGVEFVIQCYRWEKSGALFGYFVDKMNFQLELADSGGRLNWKLFKCAFGNFEEKEKRARDTVSFYKQHPEEKMPENAEKIDEAIASAEKILTGPRKEPPSMPKMPKIPMG